MHSLQISCLPLVIQVLIQHHVTYKPALDNYQRARLRQRATRPAAERRHQA